MHQDWRILLANTRTARSSYRDFMAMVAPLVTREGRIGMRLLVSVAALLLGASGCGGDEEPLVSRVESELGQALVVVLDRGLAVGCVDRGGGAYACSVKSGPVGVPASEDDPFIYAELVDVTCDRGACTWSLASKDAPGGRLTGSFRLD